MVYAERFVRSSKHECLNRINPFGERHLRRTIAEFVAHYHGERNHQGLANELIERGGVEPRASISRERSPGLTDAARRAHMRPATPPNRRPVTCR